MPNRRPSWVDGEKYPFESNFLQLPDGWMHYVDEGSGPTLLFLHGNPTWSFLYRKVIEELRDDYRCIAPDFLGFGLSSNPADWGYRPWDHADTVRTFLSTLNVGEFNLVAHDWGGPIGLSLALENPEGVGGLALMNTWMWSLNGRVDVWLFSRLFGEQLNKINRWSPLERILRFGVYRSERLTREVVAQYRFPHENAHKGIKQFPKDLIEAADWLNTLWERRDVLSDTPTLLMWGMQDPAFGSSDLERWIEGLTNLTVRRYLRASHYLPEDVGGGIADQIDQFLRKNP